VTETRRPWSVRLSRARSTLTCSMALSVKVRLTASASRPSWVDSLAMLFSPLTRRLMLAFTYVKPRFSFSLFERSPLEEGPVELRVVERLEVFHLFSDTDIPYG